MQAYFSLMSQYIPCSKAVDLPPINRRVTTREYEKVLDYVMQSDFENIYIQEHESADRSFIPSFDSEGVL